MNNVIYFWRINDEYGCFSNWYKSDFIVNTFRYFCVEQYMMSQKALLFGDLAIADKILQSNSPKEIKALGRQVSNFNEDVWNNCKCNIVKRAIKAKFEQNADLYNKLISTDNAILVEASPYDKIWGIGLDEMHAKSVGERDWDGENLLGKILMEVRDELMSETGEN